LAPKDTVSSRNRELAESQQRYDWKMDPIRL
jgi:hypothetical protein